MKTRLASIVQQFLKTCEEELVSAIDLLALIGRSIFLNANGAHFNKEIGKFFQSILKGNYCFAYQKLFCSQFKVGSNVKNNFN